MSQLELTLGVDGVQSHEMPQPTVGSIACAGSMASVALLSVPAFYLGDQMAEPVPREFSLAIVCSSRSRFRSSSDGC